ncbi:MAG: tRNA 2-thiouridine(34) synthase MnmA [Clostridiales bacterium]|nr:tRNA 2-thiouridine(34) synthase MnmA [Clostridiales bacterium]
MEADKKKVMIAMSGGVDSSVACLLLLEQGYQCAGATMHLFSKEKLFSCEALCQSAKDDSTAKDAEAVADRLGIPWQLCCLEKEFDEHVLAPFAACYEAGGTPNPCVLCNQHLKFGALIDQSIAMGCDFIATGHYARIEEKNGRFLLRKAADLSKDQSYVLYTLTQQQLAHVLFPLGGMTKDEVRTIALAHGFGNANKKDSQDICFVPDGDYAATITRYTGKQYPEGDFVDRTGTKLGRHKGFIRYTVGQRKGLGLSLNEPMYVCEKRPATNEVVLCRNEELFSSVLEADHVNWIAFDPPEHPIKAAAKIRYNQVESPATITVTGEGKVRVEFEEPQRAIASGQSVVFYDGEYVLGGGMIV